MTTLILATLLACGTVSDGPSSEPEAIAAIANQIAAAPGDAAATLEANGHTAASFDAALYDIAMDPELTRRYLESR